MSRFWFIFFFFAACSVAPFGSSPFSSSPAASRRRQSCRFGCRRRARHERLLCAIPLVRLPALPRRCVSVPIFPSPTGRRLFPSRTPPQTNMASIIIVVTARYFSEKNNFFLWGSRGNTSPRPIRTNIEFFRDTRPRVLGYTQFRAAVEYVSEAGATMMCLARSPF